MIRVDRKELTRSEIVRVAANCFMNDGYTKTTFNAMSKKLNMSPGNMTFYFPTKEHMLAELVDMLCDYRGILMEEEIKEGYSSVMVICLELLTIAAACEQDEVAKDFFLSCYRSELCMERIRKHDTARAKEVFQEYCSDWTEDRFDAAEMLVSGIEYATLLTTSTSAPLKTRIKGALDAILAIHHVPEKLREQKIEKALSLDYKALGLRVLEGFREYVDRTTEQAFLDLIVKRDMMK